jgi:hypothetical protein
MYDGTQDTQENLLKAYGELAKHFANVGIYTGYSTSRPPTASDDSILMAAPNTRYIIHADADRSTNAATIETGSLKSPLPASNSFGFGSGMTNLFSKMKMPAMSGMQSPNSGFSTGSFGSDIFKGVSDTGFARGFTFSGLTGRAKEFFSNK